MSATPGLCLEYLPLPDGGARLIRLYGQSPCPVLPQQVDGRPLTELGPYCFAPRQRERLLPPADTLRRYTVPDPAERGRYDFDEGAPDALPRLAGSFIEQITLPPTLRVMGEAAFYDCRKLHTLYVGPNLSVLGSDCLTNTLALQRLVMQAAPGQPTGLLKLLAPLRGEICVEFAPHGQPEAVLWYPEYWEDVTEVPAHMLIPTFSGRGYDYRQRFANGVAAFAEYDTLLPTTGEGDAPATLAMMAFDRLRYPYALSAQAADRYRQYLTADGHSLLCVQRLLPVQEMDALRQLLALDVMDADALRAAANFSSAAENAEATALITAALRKKAAPAKRRYDFDDF